MSEINGIYAASVSILNENLKLDISKTIKHAENLINQGCHGVAIFGSTGQAQLISYGEKIKLIEKNSENLNMQDLGLFWQLTLRTIDDLKVVSNEEIALEMFLMQLMHLKGLEDYSHEKTFEKVGEIESQIKKKNIKIYRCTPRESSIFLWRNP